jgi:hypothetical protein
MVWCRPRANPHFHQQMVYAVAMRTIRNFEIALGRRALWPAREGRSPAKAAPPGVRTPESLRWQTFERDVQPPGLGQFIRDNIDIGWDVAGDRENAWRGARTNGSGCTSGSRIPRISPSIAVDRCSDSAVCKTHRHSARTKPNGAAPVRLELYKTRHPIERIRLQTQTVPRHRHPLRQDRKKSPRRDPGRRATTWLNRRQACLGLSSLYPPR